MSVLDRTALEASPLADLHAIASELSIDGYRRLRRAALIDAILGRQDGTAAPAGDGEEAAAEAPPARRTRRSPKKQPEPEPVAEAEAEAVAEPEAAEPDAAVQDRGARETAEEDEDEQPARPRRGRRGGRARAGARDEKDEAAAEPEQGKGRGRRKVEEPEPVPAEEAEDEIVDGTVELLANGSGFVRVSPPDPSDQDVYISGAQVKRCELVSGDQIAGPRRAPRRSERFASLVRIDTINGRPAEEVADSARYDDLPAAFPTERFRLGSDDPTLKAIEWLTPFGRGSRVTIVGPSQAGKTEALRRLAAALATQEGLQLSLAVSGVRPEELADWNDGPVTPAVTVSLAFSADAQASAIELVVDQARRVAARGAHAVVLIDTLDGLPGSLARRAIAAARNIVDGGSLTVIATVSEPVGGETTVIALDRALTSTGRFPAVDIVASGTIRPDLLVGEAAAGTIASARLAALEG